MNGSKEKRVVKAEAAEILSMPPYKNRVQLAVRNMPILKLNWPKEVADTIYHFDGYIITGDRMCWQKPDIEKILGNGVGDPCCFFDYFEKDSHGPSCESRFIDRLRLVDLHFKIKYPKIARHFNK